MMGRIIIITKSTSYDGAIDVVTDLREGGDVRGSPLAVIVGLVDSRMVHTTPRLASLYSP